MDINTLSIEQIASLSAADLTAAYAPTVAEFNRLKGLEAPKPEDIDAALKFRDNLKAMQARRAEIVKTERAFAAAKDETFDLDAEVPAEEAPATEDEGAADEGEASTEDGADDESGADEGAADETPAPEAEATAVAPEGGEASATATASNKGSAVARLANKAVRPAVPDTDQTPAMSMVASADVPGFAAGQSLTDMTEVAKAIISRARGFQAPNGDGKTEDIRTFPVATLAVNFPEDLQINRTMSDEKQMEVALHAADPSRLEGGSLVAAGGWCSPSEIMYDLKADETLEGILSVPEVQVNRGGMRYTVGPQFADFYAEAGFIQTEAQAIAGTTKPCYEVDCPTFTEVRLDAVGVCIKVPILTNAAYPELVARFASGTLIAHEHMVNANVIGRMVTLAGAARVFAGLGSSVSDALEALELVANQRRQTYRLSMNRAMEVVAPFWLKGIYRADLSRRMGVGTERVTDAVLLQHFADRNLSVQFVYDWQNLDLTAEVYPTTYNVLVYPAGTFVKGVSDVVNLSNIYDAASLAVNTYTGLFVEKGLLVAKVQYDADLVTLPVCNAGRQGALDLTCV